MRTIKIGDRFNLLGVVMEVRLAMSSCFRSNPINNYTRQLDWDYETADLLDWIEEPVTLTKIQAEKVKDIIMELSSGPTSPIYKAIDSLVTKV